MKTKTVKIDARLYDAAKQRLKGAGWEIDYAIKYFLAEVAVRKRLPAFLNLDTVARSCSMCKFYEPINLAAWEKERRTLAKNAKGGATFTAVLHEAERGGYWCEVPAFAGCVSQGSSIDEAKMMIADAARCWLDVPDVRLRYRIVSRQGEIDFGNRFMTPEEARLLLGAKPRQSASRRLSAPSSEG
ncbi:MAG: hypothetical protein IKQ17_05440 [Kiritimatiellae bacterium]|nr:hypothetical protein [Kiritimatiellia bacterium]